MRPLAVVGNVNVDLVLGPVAPWPQPGTEIIVDHDELRVGGAAGNTALALAGLGIPHTIAATVGSDAFGAWLRDGFGDAAARWPAAPTGTTVSVGVTHPDGERTFLTSRGHLPAMAWADVAPLLAEAGLDGGLLLVCGSFLTDALTARYDALFAFARDRGVDVALDTGWPLAGWTGAIVARTQSWLGSCRHLLLNEAETAALAGVDEPRAAAERLRPRLAPDGTVVVKRGPGGAAALDGDGRWHEAPAPAVAVVDTIGAGDCFNAGYLAAIAAGRPIAEALAAGVAVASAAVSTAPRRYDRPERP